MKTINDVIEDLGGLGAFAAAIGVKPSTASEMRRRQSIPVRYWPRLVAAGAQSRKAWARSYDALVAMHTRKKEGE